MPDSVFPPLDPPQAVSSMSEGRAVTPPAVGVTGLGSGRAGLESHVHPSQLQGLGPSSRPSESAPHPEPVTGGPVPSLITSLPDSEASSSERLSPLSPPSSVCYSVGSEALPRHPRPGFSPPGDLCSRPLSHRSPPAPLNLTLWTLPLVLHANLVHLGQTNPQHILTPKPRGKPRAPCVWGGK